MREEKQKVLETMLDITNMSADYKRELIDLEFKKMEIFNKISVIKAKHNIELYKDKELKNQDMRDTKLKIVVEEDKEIQDLFKELKPLGDRIENLKIDIELLDNKFKAYRYLYGVVIL